MPDPLMTEAIGGAVAKDLQTTAGALQTAFGYFNKRKAQRELEGLHSPTYIPNQAISDYYSKSLARYSANPYQSSLYKMQNQNIQRGTAQGISALNDRRLGIGGIASLIQGQNDSLLKAGAAAEGEQGQRLSEVGRAAGMKAGEDRYGFQINQLMPYQQKYSQLQSKLGGANQLFNSGLQNLFSGISGGAQMAGGIGTSNSGGGLGSYRNNGNSGTQLVDRNGLITY